MNSMPGNVIEGIRLLAIAEQSGNRDLLEQAIARLRPAYHSGGMMTVFTAIPMGRAYGLRWEWEDQDEDAESALAIFARVSVPLEAAVMAGAMMGTLLGRRYERHQRPEDLDRAIQLLEDAVARTPPGTAEHAGRTRNLCRFLMRAAVARGSVAALDFVETTARRALDRLSSGDSSRAPLIAVTGSAALRRFELGLAEDDLPAIDLLAEAVRQLTDPGERRQVLRALGTALVNRMRRLRDTGDADRAIRQLEAVPEGDRDPEP